MDVCAEAYLAVTEKYDLDIICTLIDLSVEAADFGQRLIYPENEAAHPDMRDQLIKDIADYRHLEPINPRRTPRMSGHIRLCDTLVRKKGKEVPVVAFIFGPLGILSMLRGQTNLFLDLYDEPTVIHQALEVVTDTLIEYCGALMETGVHAIMLDTLFASQSIMSKSMWMEMEGRYVQRIADYIHDQGCMVMVHNCGHGIYFDVQIETMRPQAISFLHLPDDCESFEELKEKYGQQTTLVGHIPPTWLLSASVEDVDRECQIQLERYKHGGGYILATGCEYPANLELDKAEAIVEAAKKYGRYE
jgi:uroporphyrinogen decarboxylase